jgi:hypothetical protein
MLSGAVDLLSSTNRQRSDRLPELSQVGLQYSKYACTVHDMDAEKAVSPWLAQPQAMDP